MQESGFVSSLVTVLLAVVVYRYLLLFTRDVPTEYLNEQSVVDSTRNENESAIYKSPKLDYSAGLRVGLAIRYNHYKLRNGNLNDVWEIFMAHARRNSELAVRVHELNTSVLHLNDQAAQLIRIFSHHDLTEELFVPLSLFVTEPAVLAIVIACFIAQITVHICDETLFPSDNASNFSVQKKDQKVCVCQGSKQLFVFDDAVDTSTTNEEFVNDYSVAKDRGIAVKLTMLANHRVRVSTSFTQSNIVSAVASCLKHLPPTHSWSTNDSVAIVQDYSTSEGVMNGLVKMLAAFVSGSSLHLTSNIGQSISYNPSIVSANTEAAMLLYKEPTLLDRPLRFHRQYSLACNRFSKLSVKKPYANLRLIYAHSSINSRNTVPNLNMLRASTCAHVVAEYGYYNAAGPIVVSDIFDYRTFSKSILQQTSGHGGVVQSNEIKLVQYDGTNPGKIAVRGYNIGKATTTMQGVGETRVFPDDEGFYHIPVLARWGVDGCLYISK